MSVGTELANAVTNTFGHDGTFWTSMIAAWDALDEAGIPGAGFASGVIQAINNAIPPTPPFPDDPNIPNPPDQPIPPTNPTSPSNGTTGGVPSAPPTAPKDPLIIDLNNSGISFSGVLESSARFDIDNDGFRELITWISSDDGFIALDQNTNGVIDNLSELFGDETQDGFSSLGTYDNDGNKIINNLDPIYSKLLIWQDINANGLSEPTELKPISSYGIASIQLENTKTHIVDNGAIITNTSTVNFLNGSSTTVVAAQLSINQLISSYKIPSDFHVDPSSVSLPFLKGFGNIPDLLVSAQNNTAMFNIIQDLIQNVWVVDASQSSQKFSDLLFSWAGVDTINPSSRGSLIDARKVAFIEKLYDQNLAPASLNNVEASFFNQIFDGVRDAWLVRFLSQRGGLSIISADDPIAAYNAIEAEDVIFQSVALNTETNEITFSPTYFAASLQYLFDGDLSSTFSRVSRVASFANGLRNDVTQGDTSNFSSIILEAIQYLPDKFKVEILTNIFQNASIFSDDSNVGSVINGLSTNDLMSGGIGNDSLSGGSGRDTYVFNVGDGQDVINDLGYTGEVDTLLLGSGILPSAVLVRQADTGNDLVLKVNGSTDQVTLDQSNADEWYRVEQVKFADGTIWNWNTLFSKATTPTALADTFYGNELANNLSGLAGADSLFGYSGNDILTGGIGNDSLSGGSGRDTYVFNVGDGQDVINDLGYTGEVDTLLLGSGILPSAVLVRQADTGNDLVLKVNGSTDQVTLDQSNADEWYRVEQVKFADGTIWNWNTLFSKATTPTALADTFYGNELANNLSGLAGADSLFGYSGNDILTGGIGNDSLSGGSGRDTYVFNVGDGQDVINDLGYTGEVDTLLLGSGILPSAVLVRQADTGNDLVLKVNGSTDQVTLDQSNADEWYRVEQVKFADGTIWNWNTLFSKATTPTALADTFYGNELANNLSGLAGADSLFGYSGNDILTGGIGNDSLSGGSGRDTYVFNVGDGQDVINDLGYTGEVDTLLLGSGILPSAVLVRQADTGNDLVLKVNGSTDQVTLDQSNADEWYRVEQVKFADGTIWNWNTLFSKATTPTALADTFYGNELANNFSGLAGADSLFGYSGNDILTGGIGNDSLSGGSGRDTYVFNVGDGQDVINDLGYTGEVDTLLLGSGILPSAVLVRQADTGNDLVLKVNGSTDQVTLDQSNADEWYRVEQVKFADGTIWNWNTLFSKATTPTALADTFYGNELANNLSGLAGADSLFGYSGNDILTGGIGNDSLSGGSGRDTYVFNVGDGQDVINDLGYTGEVDTLLLGSGILPSAVLVRQADTGNDLVLKVNGSTDQVTLDQSNADEWYRVEQVKFADGTIWNWNTLFSKATTPTALADTFYGNELANNLSGLAGADSLFGYSGNDILTGGIGNDSLSGGSGRDTYVFNVGDGQDVINDLGYTGEVDTLLLGSGILPSAVLVRQADTGNDLVLKVNGSTDQVTLDQSNADEWYRVEQVKFADGTIWNWNTLFSKATTPTALADTFYGNELANIMAGGLGNDTLTGGAGADQFLFDTAFNATTNKDIITDFNVIDDTLRLENAIFTKYATTGALTAGTFVSGAGAKALDANDFLIYNTTTGTLSYDADGNGVMAQVDIVTLTGIPALTTADFMIV